MVSYIVLLCLMIIARAFTKENFHQPQFQPQHETYQPHIVVQSQQVRPQPDGLVSQLQQCMSQLQQCVPQREQQVPRPQQFTLQQQELKPQDHKLKSGMQQPRITSVSTGSCILPPFPENGNYVMKIEPNSISSKHPMTTNLTFNCDNNYVLEGPFSVICLDGKWSNNIPACRETATTTEIAESTESEEEEGSAKPEEENPTKLFIGDSSGGLRVHRGQLPWHVGVYDKTATTGYMQICGGTIISHNRVISAAHCFWDDLEEQRPASEFAVAAGKLYPAWDDSQDYYTTQRFDVKEIKIPPRYQHSTGHFQEDIALLTLNNDLEYNSFTMPATLDFDFDFDSKQLEEGNLGKVVGWGLITQDGKPASDLQLIVIPIIGIKRCITENEPGFRNYITSDKICAGYRNGTAACMGDSGGGLVFTEDDNGTQRHYLRGIVSTAPDSDDACNVFAWTTFTHILRHEHFIKPWLAD